MTDLHPIAQKALARCLEDMRVRRDIRFGEAPPTSAANWHIIPDATLAKCAQDIRPTKMQRKLSASILKPKIEWILAGKWVWRCWNALFATPDATGDLYGGRHHAAAWHIVGEARRHLGLPWLPMGALCTFGVSPSTVHQANMSSGQRMGEDLDIDGPREELSRLARHCIPYEAAGYPLTTRVMPPSPHGAKVGETVRNEYVMTHLDELYWALAVKDVLPSLLSPNKICAAIIMLSRPYGRDFVLKRLEEIPLHQVENAALRKKPGRDAMEARIDLIASAMVRRPSRRVALVQLQGAK